MGLNAGEVYAILGGRLNPAGFVAFDGAMKKSGATAKAFETATVASSKRSSAALAGVGKVAKVGAAAGVLAFGYAVVSSAKKAAQFEKQMASFQAVSKANERQMRALEKQALSLGASTGLGATAAAEALTELSKGGLSVQKILRGGLRGALALAAAGEMELADAATTVANALNLFGLDGRKATHVADALATAANATTADVADFAMALSQGGSAAKQAGLSFDDTILMLESLAASSVKNSDAGTSMKTALLQLIGPTEKQADAAKSAGLAFINQHGEMKNGIQIAQMLREKTEGMTKAQRTALFQTLAGTDGFRLLASLYDAGASKLEKFERANAKQGTAAKVAADKQEGAAGAMKKLGAAWESAQIVIGKEILPEIADGAEALADKLQEMAADGSLEAFGENLGEVIEGFVDVLPLAVDGLSALLAVMNTSHDLSSVITGDFASAEDAVLGMATTFLDAMASMVEAMDSIPDPLGILPDFGDAADKIRNMSDDLNKMREDIRGEGKPARLELELIVNGEDDARNKIRKLERMDLPPKIQKILASSQSAEQKLAAIRREILRTKVLNILANDGSAQQKLAAIKRLDLPPKIAKVLAETSNAQAGISAVRSMLGGLSDKTITITTIMRQVTQTAKKWFADGRGPGRRDLGVVGEDGPELLANRATGAVARVDEPTLLGLSEDTYVIPLSNKYRGRALGLMAALADDMGVEAFAGGRKPKKPKKFVPKKRDPLRLPVDDVERMRDDARQKWQGAEDRVDRLEQAGKDTGKEGADARSKLPGARKSASQLKAVYEQRKKEAREARRYADRIKAQEDNVEIFRQRMELADERGQHGKYTKALTGRRGALRRLISLLRAAQKHVPKGSAYWRELEKAIGGARVDVQGLVGAEGEFGEPVEPQLLTPDEQKRLSDLNADLALAELTTPTDDDSAALAELLAFREDVLGRVKASGNSDFIAEAAGDVKEVRDRIAGLTGSTSDDQDLRAQLEQANSRNATLAEDARISRAFVKAMSTGDLGAGGPNALAAAEGTHVHFHSTLPPTAEQADMVARTAVRGIDGQGSRISARKRIEV